MPQYPDWKQCNLKSGPTGCDGLELVNEMEEKERGKKNIRSIVGASHRPYGKSGKGRGCIRTGWLVETTNHVLKLQSLRGINRQGARRHGSAIEDDFCRGSRLLARWRPPTKIINPPAAV